MISLLHHSEFIALHYSCSHSIALFVLFIILFNLDVLFWLEDSYMFICVGNNLQIFDFCFTIENSFQCFFLLLDKYKICLQKILEEFYDDLWNENFLGHAFIVEGEDLSELDSSLDEDNNEESIANVEEIEKILKHLTLWILMKKM